jgi:hypothetical protein
VGFKQVLYSDSSHVHFRSSFMSDDFLVALICLLFSRHFRNDGHPEHVSSTLVCCLLTLSSYCKLSSGIWSYQNPELSCFIKLIDFAPSDHTVKSCFSLEHFVTGAAMMNVSQYYWSSKQRKQMRTNLGRFTFSAANSTFEIKIVHNFLLPIVFCISACDDVANASLYDLVHLARWRN